MDGLKIKKTGLFLLLLFSLYWCSITLFTHSHVLNGAIIVHSHPFKGQHSHTTAQFETIFFLSLILTTGEIFHSFCLTVWRSLIAILCTEYIPAAPNSRQPQAIRLRAPPLLVIE